MNKMDENIPKVRRGLSYSQGNNHVPKGARFKLLRRATMFSKEKKLLLLEDMIVPLEKGLSCSLGQLKFFLEDMIIS